MTTIPFLPESAPFSDQQRQWLNGYLAGLYSDANAGAVAGAGVVPGADAPPRQKVVLLAGSQSGNSTTLAEGFAERLEAEGFEAVALGMEDFGEVDLAKEEWLLTVTSTWGEGDPPDNAVEFLRHLTGDSPPSLDNLKFSVLALGDSNYLDFCGAGKKFDAALEACGAERVVERVDCDVDFEEPAEAWFAKALEAVKAAAPAGSGGGSAKPEDTGAPAPAGSGTPAPKGTYSKKNPFLSPLIDNRKLNGEGSPRDTRHFAFDLAGSGLDYEVGDVLGVIPRNCPEVVSDLLTTLGFDGEEAVPTPAGDETSLRIALEENYGMTLPSKKFLKAFVERAGNAELTALMDPEASKALSDYLWGREIVDLFAENPAAKFTPTELVGLLSKLNPRLYSIASSPKAHAGQVHLTVAAVRYDSHGRSRKGVCSTFLSDRCADGAKVPVFFQPAKHFKLPVDPTVPAIMVGPGTGIAPFRAFLHERQATGDPAKNWLFFGNPNRETDFLYEEEFTAMIDGGVLNRCDLAWSRDQAEKIYVQDKMREAGPELWAWLDSGAHFYVCGDAKRMAKDVDAALHEVIATHGGKGDDGAKAYVEEMKKAKRYQRDVY